MSGRAALGKEQRRTSVREAAGAINEAVVRSEEEKVVKVEKWTGEAKVKPMPTTKTPATVESSPKKTTPKKAAASPISAPKAKATPAMAAVSSAVSPVKSNGVAAKKAAAPAEASPAKNAPAPAPTPAAPAAKPAAPAAKPAAAPAAAEKPVEKVVETTPAKAETAAAPAKTKTVFEWKATEAKTGVQVTGSFCDWSERVDMAKGDDGVWTAAVDLSPGEYVYKFVVDGEWMYDIGMPSTTDDKGNVNNVIVV
mmetsp:Transcript_45330/g.111184  ORF Transcript_45330/g.111184 Transcript_45330/m.111184 type:complete len:253 (+) Transcript_45330:63-821(+)